MSKTVLLGSSTLTLDLAERARVRRGQVRARVMPNEVMDENERVDDVRMAGSADVDVDDGVPAYLQNAGKFDQSDRRFRQHQTVPKSTLTFYTPRLQFYFLTVCVGVQS